MKLMRVGPAGAERPALSHDSRHYDLTPVTTDIDGVFLAGDGPARARGALASGELAKVDITGQRVGAPVSRPAVMPCVGMNYTAHAAEAAAIPPAKPVIFNKAPNTVGPWRATPEEAADPLDLALRSRGNGEPQQDSTTKDRIVSVGLADLAPVTVHGPRRRGHDQHRIPPRCGAVATALTHLWPGDVLEIEITSLRRQRSECRRAVLR